MDDEIPEYLFGKLWEKCYEDFHEDLCDRVMRLSLDRFAVVIAHALEAMRYGEARAIMNDLEIKGEVVQGHIGGVWVEARRDRNVTLLLAKGFVDRMIAHDAGLRVLHHHEEHNPAGRGLSLGLQRPLLLLDQPQW